MTISNNENLTRKLDHILSLIDICCDQFRHITCSERAALLLALKMASAQVAINVNIVRTRLFEWLVDEYRIDYACYTRKYSSALQKMRDELGGAPLVDAIDTFKRPLTDPVEIQKHEDDNYKIDESRVTYARVILLSNLSNLCEDVEDNIECIIKDLQGIQEDYEQLAGHPEYVEEKLDNLRKSYVKHHWEEHKAVFMQEVRDYVADHGNKKENYERYQRQMVKDLDDLTEQSLEHNSVAIEILRSRDKITLKDIMLHFYNKKCMDLLQLRIDAFDMLQPCTLYNDLFVNRATCDFVKKLQKMIAVYGGIENNYQFAALKMVLDDFGLTYRTEDKRNGTEFMKFVNDTYLKNGEKIKDATTITKMTKLLLGRSFGKLDNTLKGTSLTEADYNKLVVPYHRCLWIIGKALGIDYKEAGFVERFHDEPAKLPAIEHYTDTNDNPIEIELKQLQSVLMGDLMLM